VSLKRCAMLMAMLVTLFDPPHQAHSAAPAGSPLRGGPQVTGTNSISNLQVKDPEEDQWVVNFDYFYTGEPPGAEFHIDLAMQANAVTAEFHGPVLPIRPQPGAHHIAVSFRYPIDVTAQQLIVRLTTATPTAQLLATQRIDKVITGPTQDEVDLYRARGMIDNGNSAAIDLARPILERLVNRNPKFDPAFIELARIAMKTNWGPEGLHQAETLLNSALQIRPDSLDAKILLGYVYAHQQRFREAESLFVTVAPSNPANVWLWTNWGELLDMQGRTDEAIVKYREAIARKPTRTAFRARESAYRQLLASLEARKDLDGLEALYRERVVDFGPGSCFSADYARFKLNVRNDAQGAIDLAHVALNFNCDDGPARQILGLASYVKWAQGDGTESAAALNQARIYLPAGPMTLYLLASNDSTMAAESKLIASGESIDQKDNEQMTALAYALQFGKLDAAVRLMRLGARPETPVGMDGMPAALLPVLGDNVEAIRVMQKAGVDFSKMRYKGATAVDFARQARDEDLLKALTAKDRKL